MCFNICVGVIFKGPEGVFHTMLHLNLDLDCFALAPDRCLCSIHHYQLWSSLYEAWLSWNNGKGPMPLPQPVTLYDTNVLCCFGYLRLVCCLGLFVSCLILL
jgi:hypothetical protein